MEVDEFKGYISEKWKFMEMIWNKMILTIEEKTIISSDFKMILKVILF